MGAIRWPKFDVRIFAVRIFFYFYFYYTEKKHKKHAIFV